MPQLRAAILDFDGLIVETESTCFASWQAVFAEHGHTYALEDFLRIVGAHTSLHDPRRLLEERCGRALDWPVLDARRLERERRLAGQQPLRPGVAALLDHARARGLALAVASSSSHGWVDGHLARTGILARFDTVVCRGDAPRTKPEPDLYLEALRRLGVPAAAAVAFEDSHNGALAAKRAGLWCVAVPSPLTQSQDFSHADLRLPSLAGVDFAELARVLGGPAAGPAP
jgi:HAD superfamily hydrolase (TIGR01509 family)